MNLAIVPSLAGFQASLDSRFRLGLEDGGSADLTLVEVSCASPVAGWERFSLLFTGPREALAQGTYRVEHGDLGSFSLFLVPVTTDGDEQHYEAVFNRPMA
jgi:hypothetical protein